MARGIATMESCASPCALFRFERSTSLILLPNPYRAVWCGLFALCVPLFECLFCGKWLWCAYTSILRIWLDCALLPNNKMRIWMQRYLPWWKGKVYVITPNQVPSWMDINHPRLQIVDQDALFPTSDCDTLPTFNTNVSIAT